MRVISSGLVVCMLIMFGAGCGRTVDESAAPSGLSAADRDRIEEMILGWTDEWIAAIVSGDSSVLGRILASDFVYTVNNGDIHDKASFIALFESDPVTYTRFDNEEVSLLWFADNVAVVTGRGPSAGIDADGNEVSGAGAFTNVWVDRDGQWQCVVGHSTDISQ